MIIDPYTWRTVAIQSIDLVADDTVSVRLTKPSGYTHIAGQYTIVRAQQLIRQYSFTSVPDDDYLELLIQREPGGVVTAWFHDAASAGDEIEVSQAFGGFTLPADTTRPLLFIAGRVGVAPFISMIRSTGITIPLLYSVRSASQVSYPDLMDSISASVFITGTDSRIDEPTIKPYLKPDQLVYICGSKRFVDGISALLYTLDVPLENVRRELFTLQ